MNSLKLRTIYTTSFHLQLLQWNIYHFGLATKCWKQDLLGIVLEVLKRISVREMHVVQAGPKRFQKEMETI